MTRGIMSGDDHTDDHVNNDFLGGSAAGARVAAAGGTAVTIGAAGHTRGEANPSSTHCSNCCGMGHGAANCASPPSYGLTMCAFCMTKDNHTLTQCRTAGTGWDMSHRARGRRDGGPAPIAAPGGDRRDRGGISGRSHNARTTRIPAHTGATTRATRVCATSRPPRGLRALRVCAGVALARASRA